MGGESERAPASLLETPGKQSETSPHEGGGQAGLEVLCSASSCTYTQVRAVEENKRLASNLASGAALVSELFSYSLSDAIRARNAAPAAPALGGVGGGAAPAASADRLAAPASPAASSSLAAAAERPAAAAAAAEDVDVLEGQGNAASGVRSGSVPAGCVPVHVDGEGSGPSAGRQLPGDAGEVAARGGIFVFSAAAATPRRDRKEEALAGLDGCENKQSVSPS